MTQGDFNNFIQDQRFLSQRLNGLRVFKYGNKVVQYNGNYGTVFPVKLSGQKKAVKCFTRQPAGLEHRTKKTAAVLQQLQLDGFIDFEFLKEGIGPPGDSQPAVLMDWVEGELLNKYVREHAADSAKISALLTEFAQLITRMEKMNIAHGDLQYGNILVRPDSDGDKLTLIDYDSLYVDQLAQSDPGILGHQNFQHPSGSKIYGPHQDRFSALLIITALAAVAENPYWERQSPGCFTEKLLFSRIDLGSPAGTTTWNILRQQQCYQTYGKLLEQACHNLGRVDLTLSEICAGLIPTKRSRQTRSYVIPSIAETVYSTLVSVKQTAHLSRKGAPLDKAVDYGGETFGEFWERKKKQQQRQVKGVPPRPQNAKKKK